MDNSYFIYSNLEQNVKIQRFHICTWEFRNNSALIEFGCEIEAESIVGKVALDLTLFVPWFSNGCVLEDFYSRLKDSSNSRFIFNDSIINTQSLDGGQNLNGVIHQFNDKKNKLCILPITLKGLDNHKICIHIDLNRYNQLPVADKPNVYIRFSIKPNVSFISTRKNGISKSTILYDIKINERRNIPEHLLNDIGQKAFCDIQSCFCFNIVPNSYDLVFFDSSSLQNVRTLEYESFNKYLGDKRVEKDELIVVFSKKKKDNPFSFFAIYSKERIGAGQFALALFINFISGVFLFIPSYRDSNELPLNVKLLFLLPPEIYIAFGIALLTVVLFIWPSLKTIIRDFWKWIISLFRKK